MRWIPHLALVNWVVSLADGFAPAEFQKSRTTRRVHRLMSVPSLRSRTRRYMSDDGSGGVSILDADGDYAEPSLPANVVPLELENELSDSFMRYAMSIIMGRALPDVRDGLKPVHRRILFAMHELGLRPSGGYRKCARVVGEVLGKFHPHGDMSVYDALVRMSQDFTMSAPLVAGHGNFGSLDNDPPAAMRYTECKLASLAANALLTDVDPRTVDYVDNFDGNEQEPTILPAQLPFLLLNGATGIAVGMATNVPPHNLGELVNALTAMIDKRIEYYDTPGAVLPIVTPPIASSVDAVKSREQGAQPIVREAWEINDDELFCLVPAPDFPTGGIIMGTSGAHKMYATGQGSVTVRARASVETVETRTASGRVNGRVAIIVTEVPYQTNKAALLERIAALVNEKKILGVSDLRDESDREGLRIVIELKRDAIPEIVLNNLFQKTPLQTSFSGNFLAIVNDGSTPGRFTLRSALEQFLAFRFETVRRRTAHQLEAAAGRAHVVEGLLVAIRAIDDVIEVIRAEPDRASARSALMKLKPTPLSQNQSEAVLGLQLGRLTSLDESNLANEQATLSKDIAYLKDLLENEKSVYSVIKAELLQLGASYGVPRRSEIDDDSGDGALNEQDLITNARSVVVVTQAGYIKRMPLDTGEFAESQGRGTRGKVGAKLSVSTSSGGATDTSTDQSSDSKAESTQDKVLHFFTCNDHDSVLFITQKGIVHSFKAWQLPIGTRSAKGVPLPTVLSMSANDATVMAAVIPVSDFTSGSKHLVMCTKRGWIKKTRLDAFASLEGKKRGLTAISLGQDDELKWVSISGGSGTDGEDSVILGTTQGFATHFALDDKELRPTGRTSRGVRALNLRGNDEIADMCVLDGSTKDLLVVTSKGFGKRSSVDEFQKRKRGGKGVIATKFKASKDDADGLACLRAIREDDEVMLSTSSGIIVRQRVANIPKQSRTATGVLVQRLDNSTHITEVAVVPRRGEDEGPQ